MAVQVPAREVGGEREGVLMGNAIEKCHLR
jgi:hypothetical protein